MRATGRDRGTIGSMDAPTRLDDELYLDFAEGLRKFTLQQLHPAATAEALARLDSLPADQRPAEGPQVADVVDDLPTLALRHRLLRSAQEMLWRGARRTYHAREEDLLADLDAAASQGPSTLTLPEGFEPPSYLVDYHLEPGGYHTDPLAGFIYHYGTKVFWMGANDHDQQKRRYAGQLPTPTDGRVHRLLDLACSVGQSTTAFKERFPDAEVHGIDVSAPLLAYAHRRANRLGSAVHFTQMAAEDLDFEDDSIDLVYGAIMFHEVPLEVGRQIVAEAARVLRPGGVFVVGDLTPTDPSRDLWGDYLAWWDTTFNGEPYEYRFRRSDFTGLLHEYFPEVSAEEQSPATTQWICRMEAS